MSKHPFFSIIIPIYNVSKFIDTGIKYILKQSFKDYEVILVDDGSTDGSDVMCDNLAFENGVIRTFHQANAGSGPARNKGIAEARGKYIVFFDIDDSIEETLLQECYDDLCSNSFPEMLIFSYDSYDVKYKSLVASIFETIKCQNNDEVKNIYVDHLLGLKFNNGFVWNKVYSRILLINNKIEFPDILIQQDEVFNQIVYRHVSSLLISPKVLYHYIIYDKGNTRSKYIEDRFQIYNTVKDTFLELYNFWSLDNERMLKYVYTRFFNSIILAIGSHFECSVGNNKTNVKKKIETILCCEETVDCIYRMQSLSIVPTRLFSKLYYYIIKRQCVFLFKVVYLCEYSIKLIKWRMKKQFI